MQSEAQEMSPAQAIELVLNEDPSLAWIGWEHLESLWLREPRPEEGVDALALLRLTETKVMELRIAVVRWVRRVLEAWSDFGEVAFDPGWVLHYLESSHADVRLKGWAWFQQRPRACADLATWDRLRTSAHTDVRRWMLNWLEDQIQNQPATLRDCLELDADAVRVLWARALLTLEDDYGSRSRLVHHLVGRLEWRPDDAGAILPVLALVMRSTSGPAWRAGLAGVVGLAGRGPQLLPLIEQTFPELKL